MRRNAGSCTQIVMRYAREEGAGRSSVWSECCVWDAEVAGSNPAAPIVREGVAGARGARPGERYAAYVAGMRRRFEVTNAAPAMSSTAPTPAAPTIGATSPMTDE